MKTIQEVLDKIEELGWNVCDDGFGYSLSIRSPEDQDFNVFVKRPDDVDALIDGIYNAYESYDPSYAASLWIGEDGHGKNGAPYDLEDLLNDMKWCKQAIYDLWCELSGNKQEFDYKEKANRMLTIAYNAITLAQLDEQYDKEDLMRELGCTEEEYNEIME